MKVITGVDEVGRGCLAGPVVACAVALPDDYFNPDIKDSKQLSARKREALDRIIRRDALAIGIGAVCNALIDKIGIAPATKQAMQAAVARIDVPCDLIIIDAVELNNLPCPSMHPCKADSIYTCVSAASIVAKVYRDALMNDMAEFFPGYGWENNKGYGSKAHLEQIRNLGPTILHRRTFISNYV